MAAGLSNLISTLLVILLYGEPSKNMYLLTQSLATTAILILNMKLFKIYRSGIFGQEKKEQHELIKTRLNQILKHIENSMGTYFLVLLNLGIVL